MRGAAVALSGPRCGESSVKISSLSLRMGQLKLYRHANQLPIQEGVAMWGPDVQGRLGSIWLFITEGFSSFVIHDSVLHHVIAGSSSPPNNSSTAYRLVGGRNLQRSNGITKD